MEKQQKKRDGPVRCVCQERRASKHRKSAEPEVVAEIRWSGCGPHLVSQYSQFIGAEASVASEAAAWRRCDPGSGRRLWPGCSGPAVAYRKSPPVRHSTVHCSSPAWKRRCCTRLSGRRRQSVDCARGAELECGSCRPLQRFSRDSRTAWVRFLHRLL